MITEQERRRIIRDWNREIEDDDRRLGARAADGLWKLVVWGVLWLVWIGVLVTLAIGVRTLQ